MPAKTLASTSFFQSLNQRQCEALQELEKFRKQKLQNANPYEPRFTDTPAGRNAREFLEARFPVEAAEFKQMVDGFEPSLQSVMYDKGWIQNTPEIHAEKMSNDPIYRLQKNKESEEWEKQMLQKMTEAADKMAASRGYDPDSQMSNANYGKFGKYFRELQEHQRLESQG